MTIDLIILGLVLLFAVVGAITGGAKQIANLVAMAVAWFAARKLGVIVGPRMADALGGVPLLVGVVAGSMLVFIPCVGEYVIPELLGGPQTQMIGRTLWDEFFSNNDWPMACAVAVAMILLVIVPVAIFSKVRAEAVEQGR